MLRQRILFAAVPFAVVQVMLAFSSSSTGLKGLLWLCLVHNTAIPDPKLCYNLHRQKRFRASGSWRVSPDGVLQLSEETSSRVGLVILSIISVSVIVCIHWWMIGPVSFTMDPVSQHVSEYIQAGLHGYRSGSGKLTPHNASPCLAILYFACFQPACDIHVGIGFQEARLLY